MTLTQDWLAAIDGTNALAATIEFSRHGLIQHVDPVDAARVVFEHADPVREFPSWPGKCNFEGKLWMASTSNHGRDRRGVHEAARPRSPVRGARYPPNCP